MNRSPLIKISVRYGAVAGALALALLVASYYLGRHPLLIAPFLDFRILLFGIFIFFSGKELRDYEQGGVLYFWQAMLAGGLVVLMASVVSTLGMQVFGAMETKFVRVYIQQMTDYLKTFPPEAIERVGKDVYDRNLSELSATNVSELSITYFAQGMVIGFLDTIILSVILRRQPKN
jgi:hypothetical protein